MYEEKELLLKKYYRLTRDLLNDMDHISVEVIEQLLDERQACINEVNQLDQNYCQIIMNPAIKELLIQISELEAVLHERLKAEQRRIMAAMKSFKKEKQIKQHYGGEPAFAPSGLFYDKRK